MPSSQEDILRNIVKEIVLVSNYARARIAKAAAAAATQQPAKNATTTNKDASNRPLSSVTGSQAADSSNNAATTSQQPQQGKPASRGLDMPKAPPPYRITETLAAFVVRAVVMDPANGFDVTAAQPKSEVDRLVKACMERIIRSDVPAFETLKMQVYFDTNFPVQLEFLRAEKQTRIQNASPLLRDIHETKAKTVPAIEGLYRKIVSYIIMMSSTAGEASTEISVVREVSAALESVFPVAEIPAFMGMTKNEKEMQLNGLVQLVTGIRLFNRELGKGGAGVDDVPKLCQKELGNGEETVSYLIGLSNQSIQQFTVVIDYLSSEAGQAHRASVSDSFVARLKSAIIFRRQMLLFVAALKEQLRTARSYLETVQDKFDSVLHDLKLACRSKSAVPVDQVYPHFMNLATIWTSFQDSLFLLALRRGILETLEYFSRDSEARCVVPDVLNESAIQQVDRGTLKLRPLGPALMSDKEIIDAASALMVDLAIINSKIEVLHPGNTSVATVGSLAITAHTLESRKTTPQLSSVQGELYRRLVIEYAGFCPVTLLESGMLVPGNWNFGLLRYQDKLYAFETVAKAKEWARNPEEYLEVMVSKVAKEQPDLVQLLHLYQYMPIVDSVENAKSKARHKLLMTALRLNQVPTAETGSQTDTHIAYDGFPHIDTSYHWNEWDLRRQALLLVNLKKKLTHSTQTQVSHFRADKEVQCYKHGRQKGTQTRKDGSTEMPKMVNYIHGLRGDPDTKTVKVVELTLQL